MKKEEKIVERFLKSIYDENNIRFEPDGNCPPDFTINSNIAIEVRRFNQNYLSNDEVEGLEIKSIPLYQAFIDVLRSFDSNDLEKSYYVSIEYKRPISTKTKSIKTMMKKELNNILRSKNIIFPYKIQINNEITLEIISSKPRKGRVFISALEDDNDNVGEHISTYVENLRYFIKEKSQKISSKVSKYNEWCLYLVDYIGWGINSQDSKLIADSISDIGFFDKVIILSHSGEKILIEILKPI